MIVTALAGSRRSFDYLLKAPETYDMFTSEYLSHASAKTLSKHILAVRCSISELVTERTQRPRYSLVSQGPWLQTKK